MTGFSGHHPVCELDALLTDGGRKSLQPWSYDQQRTWKDGMNFASLPVCVIGHKVVRRSHVKDLHYQDLLSTKIQRRYANASAGSTTGEFR